MPAPACRVETLYRKVVWSPREESPAPVGVVAPRAAVALDQVPEGRLLDVDALGGGGDAVVVHPVAVGAVGPAAGLLRGRADVDGLTVLDAPGQVEADPATARDDVAGDLVGLGVALEPDARDGPCAPPPRTAPGRPARCRRPRRRPRPGRCGDRAWPWSRPRAPPHRRRRAASSGGRSR